MPTIWLQFPEFYPTKKHYGNLPRNTALYFPPNRRFPDLLTVGFGEILYEKQYGKGGNTCTWDYYPKSLNGAQS
jgi:hypothetical protein